MTAITAFEIYSHPRDLCVVLGQHRENGLWGFTITRGPGHQYKLLIEAKPYADDEEKAIKDVKKALEDVVEWVLKVREDQEGQGGHEGAAVEYSDGSRQIVEGEEGLNAQTIEWIIEKLRSGGVADTSNMPVEPACAVPA